MRQKLTNTHFYGDTGTVGAAFVLAREGWSKHLDSTLEIAREAVTATEQEHDQMTFQPQWSVSGGMVDMGAFLANEPECMIEFPPAKTSRVGRVITLCASISVSGSISAESLVKKGQVITALALELERMGMNVELYADQSADGSMETGKGYERAFMTQRILIKGANDILDPAKILFAYAHPAMLRVLALTGYHVMNDKWLDAMGGERNSGYGSYGMPAKPPRDLPEGTLYLPESLSGEDTDVAEWLNHYLREIGLV
jgi:hypothetical protein